MHDISCRSARRWLQISNELWRGDVRILDAHLAACASCRDLRDRQWELDRQLRSTLATVVAGTSVRGEVRAQIAISQGRPARRFGPRRRRKERGRVFLPWPGWIGALVALTAAVVAAVTPQLGPSAGGGIPTAGAASHLVRKFIGYPFAIDPSRPNHLLAGAWGQVYGSWNAGDSWRQLAPLPPHLIIRALAVDAARPNRYLVAAKHSVYLSEDAGRHWVPTATGLRGAENMFLVQDLRAPGTLYLGPSTLWKSIDGGMTWARAGTGRVFAPYGIQALEPAPSGTLYTGIWGGGVAASLDGGVTWQRRAQGLARNVMDVVRARNGTLWAATDRGTFSLLPGRSRWQRSSPPGHFFATSVLAAPSYVLAGGDGVLYRTVDGGKRWRLAMNGLPLGPSINSLTADPRDPNRIYASLNSDGIFRSDDAGRHWRAVNTGIPLTGQEGSSHALLFLHAGALWITDRDGVDPGVLTVERDVTLARLAPDGAAAAYVAATPDAWAVRVVGAGGSKPQTLAAGAGRAPRALLWSPDSSLLAIVGSADITVTNLSSERRGWKIARAERIMGWGRDGRSLLFWNRQTGQMLTRRWDTGAGSPDRVTTYPARPLLTDDGRELALVTAGQLAVGPVGGVAKPVTSVASTCRPIAWSDSGRNIALRCGRRVEERSQWGQLLARTVLAGRVEWAPASETTLLTFSRGSLWSSTPGKAARKIVSLASPASG